MKRKILFLLVFLLVVATIPMLLMKRNGQPWNSLLSNPSTESTIHTRQTFYKWQDAEGHWHFAAAAPDGVQAVAVPVDTAANIIQGIKVPPQAVTGNRSEGGGEDNSAAIPAPLPGVPFTVNPANIPQLLEQTRQLQQQLGQRQQQIDAAH